uniref:Uncharacterized protein n=1 Tax=Rhizophora mucronata TaxID=61149 RepID=A0A2P2P3B9_RHIMU
MDAFHHLVQIFEGSALFCIRLSQFYSLMISYCVCDR